MRFIHNFFLILWLYVYTAFAQIEHDFIYFKNFVRHADGTECTHLPPKASFVAYLNNDQSKILLENAPRWEYGGDPNITGHGVFGVELGNFSNPAVMAGDSVFFRFTCLANETGEDGILAAQITSIPFYYFPTTLFLQPKNIPDPVTQLTLEITVGNQRLLNWTNQAGASCQVYRRQVNDTVYAGQSRMLYELIGDSITTGQFLDSTQSTEAHGYVVIPRKMGIYGPHSFEVVDFPSAPQQIEAAVAYVNPFKVAVTWWQPGDTSGLHYDVYRSQQPGSSPDSLSWAGETGAIFWLDSMVTAGQTYYYRVVTRNHIGIPSIPSEEAEVTVVPFAGGNPDLDILHISRSPKYPRFEVEYDPPGYNPHLAPGTQQLKHYPDPAESMKYTALIRNSGGGTVEGFMITWLVDSVVVQSEISGRLFPRQRIMSRLYWPWSVSPVKISCQVQSQAPINELTTQNNDLAIRSNALSFQFHVEENILDLFESHLNPMGSYSFEDWSQVHVGQINQFFAQAIYPAITPNGVAEAVFLDTIRYYHNGGLSSGGTHAPESVLWDGQWGFTGDAGAISYFLWVINQSNGMDWALLHELGHQIGLIDLYQMDVHQPQFQVIEPRTGQTPPLTPIAWEALYYCSRNNYLMHSNYENGFSDHSAGGLLRNLSKRRGYFGDYLADIPLENSLEVKYPDGTRVRQAEIWIYQKQDNVISNVTKFRGYTDSLGYYTFPHQTAVQYAGGISVMSPFSTIYSEDPEVVGTNSTLFARIAKGDSVGYQFFDICEFNVAYWSGHTTAATYPLEVENWFIIPETGTNPFTAGIPKSFRLFQNVPNPFNPETRILYHLPKRVMVSLTIYDITGREVKQLEGSEQSPGAYTVSWDGKNSFGQSVASGIYIYRLKAGEFQQSKKLIMLR